MAKPANSQVIEKGSPTRSPRPTTWVGRANGSKLAAMIAEQLVRDIAGRGWPVGEVVGSEAELLERYGVSRAVFREAVRLLEHLHVARMRRGPGGGLTVMEPTFNSVTDAVSVYLHYIGAEVDDVFEARVAIEEMAAGLAPDRLEERHIDELRSLIHRERAGKVADHRDVHTMVASIAGNPALTFFVELLNRVTLLYLPRGVRLPRTTLSESTTAHAAIVDAILAGEASRARSRMRKHLLAEADFLKSRRPSRRFLADLPELVGRSNKRAEQTARQIFRSVTAQNWPIGELLGSEAELMERYDVSRAVLREAVRVLEHHQVASMRRGRGGGLFVAEPGVAAVTEAVALQVDRLGMQPRHLFEVRGAVEMAVLERVIERADETGMATLREALEHEQAASRREFPVVAHDLHAVLASLAGNPVLELLMLVLVRLTRFHATAPPDAPDPLPTKEVIHVHGRIVQAILDRDLELARHRMRRHLEILERWVR